MKSLRVVLVVVSVFILSGCELDEAGEALLSGNYDKAIEGYKSCVDSEGDTGDFAFLCSFSLGQAYFGKGQYPEAIKYYKRAIDVYKKGMWVLNMDYALPFWIGRAYFENKQYKEAIFYFNKASSIAPQSPEPLISPAYLTLVPLKHTCYIWLGDAYYEDAQYQEAVEAYKKAIELQPPETYYQDALYQKEVGAYKDKKVIVLRHSETYAYEKIAAAYRELKQFDNALAAAKRAIEIKPTSSAYLKLARIYADKKQYTDAIAAYKKAIELEPKSDNAIYSYVGLSAIFRQKEDYATAIDFLKKAQELAPDTAAIAYYIGYYFLAAGKFDDAISSLNKAISLSTYTGVGMRNAIEENYPVVKSLMEGPAKRAGIEVGDKIIKINGQSTKGWTDEKVTQNLRGAAGTQVVLTIERKNLGNPIEKTITRETIIEKLAAQVFGLRSLAYRMRGKTEDAEKDAEKAYSLDPDDDTTKKALGAVYIDKGKYDDAIKMLSTTQKDYPFVLILGAIAYAKSGDMKKAVEIYSSIPEDYLVSKNAFLQSYKKALLESLKPYLIAQKDSAKSLEAKGQYKEALNAYVEVLKVADDDEAKQIRNDIANMIKKYPHVAELPEDARRHVMRAEASTKEGKFEDAVNEYKKAIKIAPYFPALYKAIALNYAELKQYQKAINNLNIYLELYPDAPDGRAAKDEIYKWEYIMEKERKQ